MAKVTTRKCVHNSLLLLPRCPNRYSQRPPQLPPLVAGSAGVRFSTLPSVLFSKRLKNISRDKEDRFMVFALKAGSFHSVCSALPEMNVTRVVYAAVCSPLFFPPKRQKLFALHSISSAVNLIPSDEIVIIVRFFFPFLPSRLFSASFPLSFLPLHATHSYAIVKRELILRTGIYRLAHIETFYPGAIIVQLFW